MYLYDDTEDRHIEYHVLYTSPTDIYICYSYWYVYYYSATVQKFKNDRVVERLNDYQLLLCLIQNLSILIKHISNG